jgi:hypothetical protein
MRIRGHRSRRRHFRDAVARAKPEFAVRTDGNSAPDTTSHTEVRDGLGVQARREQREKKDCRDVCSHELDINNN